jgi:diacylglycerol kinase (ATP)
MGESRSLLNQGPTHFLVNPAAGGRGSRRSLRELKDFAAASLRSAELHLTESPQHMEAIAAKLIGQGAKALLAVGGDGTLQTLVNVPGVSDIAVGILPNGSGNDFAAALGLPRHPLDALRVVLEGCIRHVDLARARTSDGRVRLYCGGGGLGLDAEAARHASVRYARLTGKPRYVLSALRALRTFRPVTVRAEFPSRPDGLVEKQVLVAAALNTPTYGAGLRLAANAKIDDGLLDVVFVEELSLRQVTGIVFDWTLRGTLRSSRISTRTAASVRFSPDRPCFFHGDGEIIGPAPVEIEVVPQAIRIFAPRGRTANR